MQVGNRQLLVIGDRVLVQPESASERTRVGLYLPQTVVEREPVQTGRIVEVGPGIAIPNFAADTSEPWKPRADSPVRFIPVQAEVGDFALFLRKEAVEVRFEGKPVLIVPQGALLLVVRGDEEPEGEL